MGDGAALLALKANGDITLKGVDLARFASDFGVVMGADIEMSEEMGRRAAELSQQISAQVEVQMNAMTRELEQKLDRMGDNEEMAMRVQERVTSALRRAEEKLADAMRKMEVRTQENEARGRRKGYGAPPPPAPPPPKRPSTTDEERMMVLRMVEQGKISVEQAEKLLAALNGQR
ncbi:MAG: hypothetical protein IPK16_18170 [Anaerolineales bacterium]|nr:hypothetical protein [Anaerolineales bacterium]